MEDASPYTVKLDKNAKAIFPNRCIVSGEVNPETQSKIHRTRVPLISFLVLWLPLFALLFLPWIRVVTVPVKQKHKLKYDSFRYLWVVLVIILVVMALQLYDFLEIQNGALKPLFVIPALIPLVVLETLCPPPFDYMIGKEYIEYDFLDLSYAKEFAELNGATVYNIFDEPID